MNLSTSLQRLRELAIRYYAQNGHDASGSMHPRAIARVLQIEDSNDLAQLLKAAVDRGILVRRNCAAEFYQLPARVRQRLVTRRCLAKKWASSPHAVPANHPTFGELTMLRAALRREAAGKDAHQRRPSCKASLHQPDSVVRVYSNKEDGSEVVGTGHYGRHGYFEAGAVRPDLSQGRFDLRDDSDRCAACQTSLCGRIDP